MLPYITLTHFGFTFLLSIQCADHSYVPKYIYTQLLICELSSSDLEASSSGSASEHRHLHKSNASHAESQPPATPSQAKRGQNRRRRQQTPESPDSEGSGSTVDSGGDGEWGDSAPDKKRQRLESKPSTSKASTIKQSKKRDVKRTSNVVRHQFQQSRTHALLQDTNGNAVHSAVFGVYELAGEQGYCERNQAPEIYRRNNMRALQCHYTLTSTSTTSDGLLFVEDPATGKRQLVTSLTFRISGVTSENEREDLPILESDNKRSKWTPTGPKRNVLPHIPPMSDGTVANGATRFHKSVGKGNDVPKSTHYEWSHLQFQAGTKHNGVRRTTQMFQFMRLSLIAEWGKGEHDRTKVASCAGQKYIVFARSPGGRKTLIKDEKEESEVTKRKSQSRQPQGSTASPGPENESGTAQRKYNRRGPKAGKRKRRRRDDSTPPPTPKAEPESDSEPLIGRKRRSAAKAGRTPRDILHLPPSTQGQEPLAATNFTEEEDQQPRQARDQRADTPPAHGSRESAERELGIVSVAFYDPTDYSKSSDFGDPVPRASTEPGGKSQLGSHTDEADESDVPTSTEGLTALHGTMVDTSSSFDDASGLDFDFDSEIEDTLDVKEDPDEKVNVEQDSPEAAWEIHDAEPNVLAGMGGNLEDESQALRTSSMLSPSTPNLAGMRPPSSMQDPSPASMSAPPDLAGQEASHFPMDFFQGLPSRFDHSGYLMPPFATPQIPAPDNAGRLDALRRAGWRAYDLEQHRQPRTINPRMLLRHETAGMDYDLSWDVDEDEVQKDLEKLQNFWNHQL